MFHANFYMRMIKACSACLHKSLRGGACTAEQKQQKARDPCTARAYSLREMWRLMRLVVLLWSRHPLFVLRSSSRCRFPAHRAFEPPLSIALTRLGRGLWLMLWLLCLLLLLLR